MFLWVKAQRDRHAFSVARCLRSALTLPRELWLRIDWHTRFTPISCVQVTPKSKSFLKLTPLETAVALPHDALLPSKMAYRFSTCRLLFISWRKGTHINPVCPTFLHRKH